MTTLNAITSPAPALVTTVDSTGNLVMQAVNSIQLQSGSNTATLPAATGTVMVSGNQPAFNVYNSNQQSITSGVFTKMQFNTKNFDTANAYDNVTNYRFTPQVAGYYQFSWMTLSASSTTSTIARLFKNGSTLYNPYAGNGLTNSLSGGSALVYMNGSTDYVEVYGYLLGSSPVMEAGLNASLFCGVMVRAA
jgi:hypothetical protein